MLIQIKRDSIKKNPRAGRSDYQIPCGRPYWQKKVTKTEYYQSFDNKKWTLTAQNTDENLSYHQEVQTIYSLSPEPAYLYEHEDPILTCEFCKAQFNFSELKEEWDDDGVHFENMCPKCGVSECCEVSIERIEEVLKERDESYWNQINTKLKEGNEAAPITQKFLDKLHDKLKDRSDFLQGGQNGD